MHFARQLHELIVLRTRLFERIRQQLILLAIYERLLTSTQHDSVPAFTLAGKTLTGDVNNDDTGPAVLTVN